MNKDEDRRPPADSLNPSGEAAPTGPESESPKGQCEACNGSGVTPHNDPNGEPNPKVCAACQGTGVELPRYTIANLTAWRDTLDRLAFGPARFELAVAEVEAIMHASRFLSDTIGTLRAQAQDRQRRAALDLIARRKARKRSDLRRRR